MSMFMFVHRTAECAGMHDTLPFRKARQSCNYTALSQPAIVMFKIIYLKSVLGFLVV